MIFVCNKCGFLWISNTINRCHCCGSADLKFVPDRDITKYQVEGNK